MTDRARHMPPASDAGFTLIELMIALVIIAVGVMTLSGVQTRSSRDVYSTGRRTNALALAEEHIEIQRAAGYANAVSDSGQTGPLAWWARVDSADIELRRVAVTVTWTEGTRPQALQLMTLMSRR